jgi:hypothetical protein
MEARFIDAFRKADVAWRVIRLCAERACQLCGGDHPFATQRFRIDGRTIFAEIAGQAGEELACVRPHHRPDRPANPIVLDPRRSFGQPIVSTGGVPTAVIADAVTAEGFAREGRAAVSGAAEIGACGCAVRAAGVRAARGFFSTTTSRPRTPYAARTRGQSGRPLERAVRAPTPKIAFGSKRSAPKAVE